MTTVILIWIITVFSVSDGKRRPLTYPFLFSVCTVYRWETMTIVIPILSLECFSGSDRKQVPLSYWFIFTVFSVSVGNVDNCHTDFNSHWIQWIGWEAKTTVNPILILTVFMYPMWNGNHCHTDSNFHCIQFIRLETRTTVKPILFLAVFSVSDGKRGPFSYQF